MSVINPWGGLDRTNAAGKLVSPRNMSDQREPQPSKRRRGRPKSPDAKRLSHVVQLRLNDVQRTYLLLLSEEWECSISEAARRCIDEHLDADPRRISNMLVNGEPATLRQMLGSVTPAPEWVAEQLRKRGGKSG